MLHLGVISVLCVCYVASRCDVSVMYVMLHLCVISVLCVCYVASRCDVSVMCMLCCISV